jgi:hypothetical protein
LGCPIVPCVDKHWHQDLPSHFWDGLCLIVEAVLSLSRIARFRVYQSLSESVRPLG